ncbi:hypothetical protein LR48_Vigan442s001500 [Vigna angularis]|uniref:SHSP domain-containing protein n=2 Tax=Phaseolus angularis TaxID=3914 RepID=A0A0L9TBS7_PHAAN|nr:uncharacterized protein LOC108320803 [Vigna angularis]KAG2375487.1 uncharacterized protein HKW66_Vig0163590 [Vigna angularis]KOM27579.1 hypothetical protein LR48_Vigan442s001500 [Vigna angularis]BAU00779.1 hypothetical protein VIGAN_10240000 [Vigna angularis var. angularis]
MARKRNIAVQNQLSPLFEAEPEVATTKKLRRLPHVFTRVLQLPIPADADVSFHEAPNCFRFVVETPELVQVEAHIVQIHPGMTKVVVSETVSLCIPFEDLHLDVWRTRLPDSTRPDLTTAVVVGGELVVTVPKSVRADDLRGTGAASTPVLV